MKNKKLIIFVFICSIIFCIFYYIFSQTGNNINRSEEQIVEDILNEFDNYEAKVCVIVKSNKNENKYEMTQKVEGSYSRQEIISPENIKNIVIELEKNKLKILNSKYNMERVYEDYNYVLNNSLFLNTFKEDYSNYDSEIYEKDGKIVVGIKMLNNSNTYIKYKDLYLNAKSYVPEKLVIKDTAKNPYISILYNDIEIK